jgi:ketosteroid isomerase-like protein
MSKRNVKTITKVFEAVAREDWVAVAMFFDPDSEIHDFDIPDAGVQRGPDGFFDWLARWDSAWENWEIRDLEVLPAAGDRVVALFTMVTKGRGSGIEMKRRDAIVYTLHSDRILRLEYYNEQQKEPALEAAGLRE